MATVPGVSLPSSSSKQAACSDPLAEVPAEARRFLWQGLLRAVDQVLGFCEQTPPGTRHVLPPRVLTHCGPRFNPAMLTRLEKDTLRRVYRIEHSLAADALEAWILDPDHGAEYARLFMAHCTRIGQIYSEIKRRWGMSFALSTLHLEVKLLRYRGSLVIEPLLFEEIGRPGRSA